MLRTNSRKAKQNIRKYIMDSTDFSAYGYEKYKYLYDPKYANVDRWSMWKHALNEVVYDEKIKYDTRRLTIKEYYKEWLQGLPFDLGDHYYSLMAKDVISELLEQSKEEQERFSEEEAEEFLTHLIIRELLA